MTDRLRSEKPIRASLEGINWKDVKPISGPEGNTNDLRFRLDKQFFQGSGFMPGDRLIINFVAEPNDPQAIEITDVENDGSIIFEAIE